MKAVSSPVRSINSDRNREARHHASWMMNEFKVVTLGYHISPTLSRNCLVYRFLLRVVILDWCLRVILNAPGMVHGCDPGPGMIWTMVHGRGLCVLTQVHWVI